MRIKKIDIIGFKSFYDKTTLHIHEPITAVVGPNGCGKSNIIDAIRWCMGEQSAKHLRGKNMEDVIFAGSETRSGAGMAEVSLTFENVSLNTASTATATANDLDSPDDVDTTLAPDAGDDLADEIMADEPLPIDFSQYGEVTVTRRLFRDGSSDYFLNKTPCRLRDITDFFLGTGVGTKAYSIIEQGRVGMIVSSKPEDRRLIIEEAAGITKFKKKKQAAEKKMEQTRLNLTRVSDIVGEIDKRLGSLRRQAQKAERYKKYRAEVRDIEMWSASHRFLGLQVEEGVLRGNHAQVIERRDTAAAELERREAALVAERAELSVEEKSLSELIELCFELENKVKLGESQVDYQNREAKELESRVSGGRGEVDGLRRQLEEARVELGRVSDDGARLEGEAASRTQELARLEEESRRVREELTLAQGDLDAARAEISKAQQDIARQENNQRSLDRRRGDLELRSGRVREEEDRLAARQAELGGEVTTHEERLAILKKAKVDLAQRKDELERRLAELQVMHKANEADVERLRSELNRRKSRLQSLKEIQDKYEGFARGTQAVMKRKLDGVRGLVADVVQAPEDIEAAVEAVLGERLSAILVATQQVGVDAIASLKKRAEGRSTFIPVTELTAPVATRVVMDQPGVRGVMLDLVKASRPEYRPIVEMLFEDIVVVESLARALELYAAGVRHTLVTLEGDIVDAHGVVTGGSRDTAGAGVLQQKREIRELEELCAGLDRDFAAATERHTICKTELEEVRGELEVLRRDTHQGEITILAAEKDLSRWKLEADRLAERGGQLARDRKEVDGQLAETAREAEESLVRLNQARRTADDAERRQLNLIEGVTVTRGSADDVAIKLTECKVRVAQVGAERNAARQQLTRLEDQTRELARRIERLVQMIDEGGTRATGLRSEAQRLAEDLIGLREERRTRAEELTIAKNEHEHRLAGLQIAEVEARGVRTQADKLITEASKLEVKIANLDSGRRHLEETIAERYRVPLRLELFEHHLRPPIGEEEEARLRELRELIERMGEINLTAIEECEELTQRYDFLVAQKTDLEGALGQLEKAIAKINKTSRKRFRETFDAVNKKFQEVFPRLFRGGRAELRLVGGDADEDLLDAGVEISAQPPGKKNQSVELMSGGEKALTAVALIFSIFLIKPSPFCILDEVDAPLDEANVGRYNELVREMTDRSQFIVITHNKRTMEIADTLYGITMEEPGCSKLVNVNLRAFGQVAA
jgi:chromosome segregation protein